MAAKTTIASFHRPEKKAQSLQQPYEATFIHGENLERYNLDNAKRILLYSEAWGYGGIESFLMNLIRYLPSDKYSFDIFTTWSWNTSYDEELKQHHVNRYCAFENHKPNLVKRSILGVREFNNLLHSSQYDIVHINTMNGYGFVFSKVAKTAKVPIRVVHSHNSSFGDGGRLVKSLVHSSCKSFFKNSPTDRIACSQNAGRYMFGSNFEVVYNGINVDRFAFNQQKRREIRSYLRIDDNCLLVGSIGRLSYAKNPLFQLEVFDKLRSMAPNSKYLMIGSGELEEDVARTIKNLSLEDQIIRIPATGHPEAYYCALDAFLFPSLFEGFGIAPLEAQCAGLPVFMSSNLPKEIHISSLIHDIDISKGAEYWAQYILKNTRSKITRNSASDFIRNSDFNVQNMAAKIEKIYLKAPYFNND